MEIRKYHRLSAGMEDVSVQLAEMPQEGEIRISHQKEARILKKAHLDVQNRTSLYDLRVAERNITNVKNGIKSRLFRYESGFAVFRSGIKGIL